MQDIYIYMKDRDDPVSFTVNEVKEGMQTGVGAFLTFKDEEDREGRIVLNPENIAMVAIFPR